MRKVLAVFMAVMMILTTFTGIMTVSAADVTTTLVEIPLGNMDTSAKKGTLTATDYVKSEYTFAPVSNGSWASNVVNGTSADAKTIKATYAEPKYTVSTVNTSDLSAYTGIASGHSAKLLKFTQTANHYMFRLKDFYDVSALPATGKLRFSLDVYPADVTPGTTESTTASSVKSGTATLADTYTMRVGDSTGSGDASTMTKTAVTANQWNTLTHEIALSTRATMDSVRIDVATGINNLASYTKPFPATVFYDKLKIEYIGEAISGGGSTGGDDNTGDDNTGDDNTGDDNTGDDNTGGEVVTVWEEVLNIPFENSSCAPAEEINIWGKLESNKNTNTTQSYVTYSDESISKPNTTEDFGTALIKADASKGKQGASVKGLVAGRVNDFIDFTFEKGAKYKYSIWAYLANTTNNGASDTAYMTIQPCVGSETSGVGSKKVTLAKGQWQKIEYEVEISGDYEAAAGQTSGFRFAFSATEGTNYPEIIYLDNAKLEKLTEKVVDGDDTTVTYDLAVTSAGNGTVTGAGTYKEGDTATLTATPSAGYIFAGWYNGTTLLSKENPYEYTVDGKVTAITGKFEKFVPNTGDNWKTIDTVDFEDATTAEDAVASSGTTSNGLTYKMSALNGGNDIEVASAITTEQNAGIGTSSNNVYKFERVSGTDGAGMMRLSNFFSLSDLSVGDIVRVSFKVYPTDLYVPEGASDKTAGFQAFYSISGKYGSGKPEKVADSTGTRYIKVNEWNEIGFTTTITQEMLDASDNAALRLSAAGKLAYAKTLYFDDFKAEVYEDKPAADLLNFVEDFEKDYPVADITKNTADAPYATMNFTKRDADGSTSQYTRFNRFGTGVGTTASPIAVNAADLSGVVAHSGTTAVKWAGRFSANGGAKIEDIFMGRFDKDDIGRKIKVSVWVYADKSSGAYKLKWDEDKGDYVETTKFDETLKYSEAELADLEKTIICISLAGPNDDVYQYRSGNYNLRKYEINWNEWTKISTELVISEDVLDNGITDQKAKNPLISAIRIDQQGATGKADQAIIDTFYIDDITIEEAKFEVSGAIGSHMVYQKGRPIRVWGTNADVGEAVTVKFNGETKTATTDADENWMVEFGKIDTYTRDLTIEISCPGEEAVKYEDVSIGEVILASGQSNMEWNLRKVYQAEDIIADAETNENISILSFEPTSNTRGSYEVLKSPKGAYWTKKDKATAEICSGVGYITAYNIAKKYDIPVAVVDANLSGSSIKAWLSAETIEARKDDVYKAIYEEMINKSSSVSSGSIWKVAPAGMYNSLLAPLDNYEIGIMLWYQGCSDSGKADLYNYQQYDLINSWRELFGAEDTPFYICQLAPYSGSYMNLRQVQLDTAKRMDNVHLIVTADLGPTGSDDQSSKLWSEMTSGNEIHPVRKIPVADRICLNLYANYFGEDILYSGPEYIKMESKEDHAILHFKHIGSGIVKSDETKDITGFEISQNGETFVTATAEILADNTIKVYAEGITNPKEVRYCWVNWVVPEDALTSEGGKKLGNTLGGNLTNDTGIPVGPFRATLPAPTIFAAETATTATGLDIGVSVRNKGYSEASPRLIVGLYDGNRLVGLKSETIDFKTIDTKTLEFKFYTLVSNITDNTTVKAFLWDDMGSMIPLTSVYPIER